MNSITVTIPLPHKATHPNSRTCWQAKAKHAKTQRVAAHLAAKAVIPGPLPMWPRVRIKATFYRWFGKTKSDPDNLIAWLKSSIDGLQDAGIVSNDRGVVWDTPEEVLGKAAGSRSDRVEILIEALEAGQ